jgi:hypothetical protein
VTGTVLVTGIVCCIMLGVTHSCYGNME